jgi:hypothetical protein
MSCSFPGIAEHASNNRAQRVLSSCPSISARSRLNLGSRCLADSSRWHRTSGRAIRKGGRFMFTMLTVASLCVVVLIAGLLSLACKYRPTMWVASDDAITCFVAPAMIMFGTFGVLSLGWRLTHGGVVEVSAQGWIGSVVIVAISVGIWILLARWIRAGRRDPVAGASPAAAGARPGPGASGSSR